MPLNLWDREWKEFKVSEILEKPKLKKFSKMPEDDGDIPFVSSTSENNGISNFIYCDNELTFNKPCLTVSTNGANFDTFYHNYRIAVSTDVDVLFNENLNKNHYLFLATVLKTEKYRYSYGKKAKNNAVSNTIIKLPVNEFSKPDWNFMNDYIVSLRERERENIELSQRFSDEIVAEPYKYKEFKISNILEIQSSVTNLDKVDICNDDFLNYPYITRTNKNNGMDSVISFQENVKLNKGNCIIIGLDTQTCFYQNRDFYTGQNIHIIRYKEINRYNAFFIIQSFKTFFEKYSWGGHGLTLNRLKKEILLLPVTQDGSIDWEYMENYIKSLPYSKYL